MLNVPDALFVSPLFFIFMLPIAIADVGVVVGWSMRVENSYIHESPLIASTPETVHCNVKPGSLG